MDFSAPLIAQGRFKTKEREVTDIKERECVCVRERERECVCVRERERVCVCVFVCV